VLDLVACHMELEAILDRSPFTDLQTLRILDDLLTAGLVRASESPPRDSPWEKRSP